MKALYLDCPSGISGDMLVAGLADLGLNLAPLEHVFSQAGLNVGLRAVDDVRCGIAGKRLEIEVNASQPMRRLEDLLGLVEILSLSPEVTQSAKLAFEKLAKVEAMVHGVHPSAIHFHEVGAMDTLIDVVGAFWGLRELNITSVHAGPLPWFRGSASCAHGQMPLPAPAVVELLRGKPIYDTHHDVELITPTGALLLDQLVSHFTSGPRGTLLRCGIGLGTMNLEHQPNALRCLLFQPASHQESIPISTAGSMPKLEPECTEDVVLLTTNIDHLTGEELGNCFEALLHSGALDVLFLPGMMKKNRPGGQLQVLCRPDNLAAVQKSLFQNTLSLGVRRQRIERVVLTRRERMTETTLGELPQKETEMDGELYRRPEFEALQGLARRTGRSVAQLRYLLGSGMVPGHAASGKNSELNDDIETGNNQELP